MLLTIKFLSLGTLFVVTGGAVFSDWGRRHRLLVFLAGIVAVLASTYLLRDILEDFRREMREELGSAPAKQEADAKRKKLAVIHEAMADVLTGDPGSSKVSVIDADNCVAQFLDAHGQHTVYFSKMGRGEKHKLRRLERGVYVVEVEGDGLLKLKSNFGAPVGTFNRIQLPLDPDACPPTEQGAKVHREKLKNLLVKYCKMAL